MKKVFALLMALSMLCVGCAESAKPTVTFPTDTVTTDSSIIVHEQSQKEDASDTPDVCEAYSITEDGAHEHNWTNATCTAPKTCRVCGATEGSTITHEWRAATCYEPRTCAICGVIEGTAKVHDWKEATCTEPKVCIICGTTEGGAVGHDWKEATCTEPRVCIICGTTEGGAVGHDWKEATCTEPKVCIICGMTEGGAVGHDWKEATCTEPKVCIICGTTEGSEGGHDWKSATCTRPKTCRICGETKGSASHDWMEATCETPKTCRICGVTEGETKEHVWKDTVCTGSRVCGVCGATESVLCDHDWMDATCTEPKTCGICGETSGSAIGHNWMKLSSSDGNNIGSTIISICTRCRELNKSTVGEIDFTIRDNLPDGNGKTGRVILLGGQSNASGTSLDEYLKTNVSPEKYAEYDDGYDNVYINYHISDGTYKSQGFVKCATRQGEFGTCFGPELGLAEKLTEMYPDEMFFIIKYAWGGTNLFEQWLSPSSNGKTGVLYKQFVKFVEESIRYLEDKNYAVKIEGMCWMQGESDSFSVENGTNYRVHLSNLIKDIRSEFADQADLDGIAFVDACIADNPNYWVYGDLVNQSKREVVTESPMNALIDTNAHGLTFDQEPIDQPDMAHYDSLSQIKLGNLFAEKVADYFD